MSNLFLYVEEYMYICYIYHGAFPTLRIEAAAGLTEGFINQGTLLGHVFSPHGSAAFFDHDLC